MTTLVLIQIADGLTDFQTQPEDADLQIRTINWDAMEDHVEWTSTDIGALLAEIKKDLPPGPVRKRLIDDLNDLYTDRRASELQQAPNADEWKRRRLEEARALLREAGELK